MTTNSPDFQRWTASLQAQFESRIGALLPAADIAPQRLHAAMRYAVLGGGKRVRPLLAFAAGGVDGVGLGNGRQQNAFLPEAHTD